MSSQAERRRTADAFAGGNLEAIEAAVARYEALHGFADPGELGIGDVRIFLRNDSVQGISLLFKGRGRNATLETETLSFIARAVGAVGNEISVECVKPLGQNSEFALTADDREKRIRITLSTSGEAVAASVSTADGDPTDADLVFTARETGSDGNDDTVVYQEIGSDAVGSTTALRDGSQVVVTLKQTAFTAATALDTLNGILFTSKAQGAAGNSVGNTGVEVYAGNGSFQYELMAGSSTADCIVHLDCDGSVLTVQELIDLVNDDGSAAFTASLASGDGTALVTNSPVTLNTVIHFTGGVSGAITATAAQVKAAIEADNDSNALIAVSYPPGKNGSGTITANDILYQLQDGAEADSVTITAGDVKDAIDADPIASDLVIVQAGEGMAVEFSKEFLTNGDDDALVSGTIWSD